jgi:uncharacterized protein involved in exopolysaccharide biosynthesis
MTTITKRNLLVATTATFALACAAGFAATAPQKPGTSAQIDYNGWAEKKDNPLSCVGGQNPLDASWLTGVFCAIGSRSLVCLR